MRIQNETQVLKPGETTKVKQTIPHLLAAWREGGWGA